MFVKKIFLLLFIIYFFYSLVYSQSFDIKFEHLSVEQGLSNNKIRSVLQDKLGFIWIGTYEGLNRFDGYEFKIFRNDPEDSTSLSSNWITDLFEDSAGDLWISTMGGGLNKFDHEKEHFIPVSHNVYNRLMWQGKGTMAVKQIAEYQYKDERVLWIGSAFGLLKLNLESEKITHYPHTDGTIHDPHIQALVVDSSGMVWLGSVYDGLHKFNPQTEQFSHYRHDPADKHSLSNNMIFSLCIDHYGTLWIATDGGGLNRYDARRQQFISYMHDPADPRSVSSNKIRSVYESHSGVLWVGTADKGLNLFDRKTETFTCYLNDSNDPSSLSDNMVWDIFEDKTGILWLSTWGGINKIVPRKNQFSNYKKIPGNPGSLPDDFIGAIHISYNGNKESLWIGTRKGLSKIDRETGKYTQYLHKPSDVNSIPADNIIALFEDRSGILWIGTQEHGLIKFDMLKKQFKSYLRDPQNQYSISSNMVTAIHEDKQGVFWIGTYNGSLDMFDRQKEIFKHLFGYAVYHIFEDRFDDLWVAAWAGLRKYDRKTGEFTIYLRGKGAVNWPELNRMNYILEPHTEKNVLWVGTYSGLNHFDRRLGEFTTYTVKDGLPSNVINSMLEDNQGNLWLGTNNGLSRFNPQNKTFKNFDVHDGLLSSQFSPGACAQSKTGEMFFCTSKGVNAFYPDKIIDNKHIPDIVITNFQLFNKSVGIKNDMDSTDDVFRLDQPVSLTEGITLSYQQNIIEFQFAALDYNSPQKNKYAYKMQGVDPDWIYTDASRRFATYTNLGPGEYVFRVKGSNNDGIWNEEGTSITIIITPPWWQTQLAYIFYFVFFIGIIITTWRLQLRRIQLKQQMQMEHFEAEKLREVDHLKSRFFANISHEFRTPLTLIKGPLKQLLNGEFAGNIKETYKMMLRNSDRLLGLINQILDLSKLEAGEIKLKVAETDIIKFIKGMVLSFSPLAETKKVKLKFSPSEKSITGFIDRDKVEKIVTNLLSNAFKFTPEGGEVEVTVTHPSTHSKQFSKIHNNASPIKLGEDGPDLSGSGGVSNKSLSYPFPNPFPYPKGKGQYEFVEISISNTGPGITPDHLDKIFDRFYSAPLDRKSLKNRKAEDGYPTGQAGYSYQKDGEGTGIGLALTKELVEVCHSEISASSIPGMSTTFKVKLPIDKESFKEDEIVEKKELGYRKSEIGIQISEENTNEEVLQPNRSPASSVQSPLLLIVEDNPDVTHYISSFMENDYRILIAENGKEGLKKTIDKNPDLLISDVMMPEMDGFELCKKIKSDERISHIPVILLTAKADLDSKIEGLEFGADDYVTKPFEARELQIRAKNLIEQRRKLREKFSLLVDLNPADIAASSMDEQLLQRLLAVFEKHMEEPEFSIEQLAREIGMSRRHLNRKIQALTNLSTSDFIRTLRLQRAAAMLSKSAETVSEIAYRVGFNNLSYFTRAFRKHFGKPPREFSKKQ